MKKLFYVEIVSKMYVLADDEEHAKRVALPNIKDQDIDQCFDYIGEVKDASKILKKWKNSYPVIEDFYTDDSKTCEEIVNELYQK